MSRLEFQNKICNLSLDLGDRLNLALLKKNLATKFWPCHIESWFFRRGSSYFSEAQKNGNELPPDVNAHISFVNTK